MQTKAPDAGLFDKTQPWTCYKGGPWRMDSRKRKSDTLFVAIAYRLQSRKVLFDALEIRDYLAALVHVLRHGVALSETYPTLR